MDGGTNLTDFHDVIPGPVFVATRDGEQIKHDDQTGLLVPMSIKHGSGYQLMASGTDTTYTSGAPGIGFFSSGGAPTSGYGLSFFTVTATS